MDDNLIEKFIKEKGFNSSSHAKELLPSLIAAYREYLPVCCQQKSLNTLDLIHLWNCGKNTYCSQFQTNSKHIKIKDYIKDIKFCEIFENSGEVAFTLGFLRSSYISNPVPLVAYDLAKQRNLVVFEISENMVLEEFYLEFERHKALSDGLIVYQTSQNSYVFFDSDSDRTRPVFESFPFFKGIPLFLQRESIFFNKSRLKIIDKYLRSILSKKNTQQHVYDEDFHIIREQLLNGKYANRNGSVSNYLQEYAEAEV